MIRPTDNEWNSLANLIVSGDDAQKFIGMLERSLREQDALNRSLEGVALHRGQGVSLVLADLLQCLSAAPDVRRKIRDRS